MRPDSARFIVTVGRRRITRWAVAAALVLGVGCTKPPAGAQSSSGATSSPATATQVVFTPAGGAPPWPVQVEVARTQDELMRGLMFRRELGANNGMLFIFPEEDIRRFWMHNTYIPLDMVFLDSHRVVVGIIENAVPQDDTSRGPDSPARYVVEVRGGYAQKHGVTVGARAEFRNLEPNIE
jgi:uncharacterized membrane protein (UPF0127 family)